MDDMMEKRASNSIQNTGELLNSHVRLHAIKSD